MRREGAGEEIIRKVDNREKSEKSLQILSQKVKSEKYIFSQKILQKFVFCLNMKMLILPLTGGERIIRKVGAGVRRGY